MQLMVYVGGGAGDDVATSRIIGFLLVVDHKQNGNAHPDFVQTLNCLFDQGGLYNFTTPAILFDDLDHKRGKG